MDSVRFFDLRQKEVINIKDGTRLGYICDLIIGIECGEVEKIIIPGPAKLFGIFGPEKEYHIDWDKIVQIGADLVLVDVDISKCEKDIEY